MQIVIFLENQLFNTHFSHRNLKEIDISPIETVFLIIAIVSATTNKPKLVSNRF